MPMSKSAAAGAPRSTKISPASSPETNSFYLATALADGQPYIQHRGGPKGFVKILDKNTIAFADYSGNRQYITQGNLSENPKAHIFVMDYAHRRRVKIWGEARVVEDDPALTKSLMPQGYKARPEQVILFRDLGVGHQLPAAHPAKIRRCRRRAGACLARCPHRRTRSGAGRIAGPARIGDAYDHAACCCTGAQANSG